MAHVQICGCAKKRYISEDCSSSSFPHKVICQVVKIEQTEMWRNLCLKGFILSLPDSSNNDYLINTLFSIFPTQRGSF